MVFLYESRVTLRLSAVLVKEDRRTYGGCWCARARISWGISKSKMVLWGQVDREKKVKENPLRRILYEGGLDNS